jgi:hypothetical protein
VLSLSRFWDNVKRLETFLVVRERLGRMAVLVCGRGWERGGGGDRQTTRSNNLIAPADREVLVESQTWSLRVNQGVRLLTQKR